MSKVSFFAAAAVAALAFSTAAPVFAVDGGQYDSKGSIEFTPSTTPTSPVDPLNPDPDNPIVPSNPDGSTPDAGTAGPLSLDFASSLDFGTQQITSSTINYNASAQKYTDKDGKNATNGPDFVQLTDNRGSFTGWTLSVKQAGQFKTASGTELDGATVTFGSAQHVAANGTTDGVTTTSSFTLDPAAGAIPVMSGEAATTGINGTSGTHLLRFGDASALSTADVNGDGSSRGTTDTAIKLNVPGKTAKMAAKYTTTFNWILADAPSAVTVVK
jgi:hypothetical protein